MFKLSTRKSSFLALFGQSVAVYFAAAFVLFLALYAANSDDSTLAKPSGEAGSAVPVQTPAEWQEDTLPNALYEWVGVRGESSDLQNWGEYDGHVGCWAAVAETTLIMCPDGFTETS